MNKVPSHSKGLIHCTESCFAEVQQLFRCEVQETTEVHQTRIESTAVLPIENKWTQDGLLCISLQNQERQSPNIFNRICKYSVLQMVVNLLN